MKKVPGILLFAAGMMLSQSFPAHADTLRGDSLWAMFYLLEKDDREILDAIRSLEEQEPRTTELYFSLSILYLNLCMQEWDRGHAGKGHKYIRKVAAYPANPELLSLYKGISFSFQGRIKTILGIGDLQKAEEHLLDIPVDFPDWVIRFLRGITLINLGKGLPDIFFFKESIKKSLDLGSRDLLYVLRKAEQAGVERLNPETYDRNLNPIPARIKIQAREHME